VSGALTADSYVCVACGAPHACGADACAHLFYNADNTQVCAVTGACFAQRACSRFASAAVGIRNREDPDFAPRAKRDQQVRNAALPPYFIADLIGCITRNMPRATCFDLYDQLARLWAELRARATAAGRYIHRKDRRCFTVAATFSLRGGLATAAGVVIAPHPHIDYIILNKKHRYATFAVTDVRYGQKLMIRVFSNAPVESVLRLR